ncbi:CRISPR-associated endoribonuclease Cas6 [Lyngbya sp. CCY1209]|uniref:CRISPR-associated endoribonuclease Cas6 n=1 Tax=Lyngbya sp. CCY1209 TaxID=2886103 RepID=UPI002D20EC2D|nr:CRISPR-associated endoribonuclease Cas6 [Lyngbya sp. CCY1209]MEB3884570.1 CRISPR-associated endoribonuclease Cas6 [Lyngbya sp. CCY1209]
MTPTSKHPRKRPFNLPDWPSDTELVGLEFELVPGVDRTLYAQYTVGLHAWFLDQVRDTNPELSQYLHDGQSEKPFTISALDGPLSASGKEVQLQGDRSYRWSIVALSSPLVEWLDGWVHNLPRRVELRNAPLEIRNCRVALEPTTYRQLWEEPAPKSANLKLSFTSPTSFRHKGHHLPLPLPINLFHSYLRRWNDFSDLPSDRDLFLEWVDEFVVIQRHRLESVKVAAGKRGMVTGFTGAIELGISHKRRSDFQGDAEGQKQLFYALGRLAPYCGTGHKTTFGLGQTRFGWQLQDVQSPPTIQQMLADRISELTAIFLSQRRRTGGNRAADVAETWATILARRELGESLQAIAIDLEMPYETVKTYAKLARRALK